MKKNSVVIYKNLPAIVTDRVDGDKWLVSWCASRATDTGKKAVYAEQKVREKDVLLLCEDASAGIDAVLAFADEAAADGSAVRRQVTEAYELLSGDDETAASPITFADLAALVCGELRADEAWGIYAAVKASLAFEEQVRDGVLSFVPRSAGEVAALQARQQEKEQAGAVRAAFIARLKSGTLLPDDAKYMGDVESLALGQTEKSRTMHDAHLKETPERAHKLLLDTGVWDMTRNPYPLRWGLSMRSAREGLAAPPDEERVAVPGVSYAIDSRWSHDPDDAIAFDGECLWVHIADPASTVFPDSPIDRAARARGATLYIPEGASRMLSEDSLADYALGLAPKSRALSFKITFDEHGDVADCAVLRTVVTVERLTYEQADARKDEPGLAPLFALAARNAERRRQAGAVQISLPEVHITVDAETKRVSIEPRTETRSAEVVREAMVLAGEGAARFAFKNGIPFPFVSQEAPDIPQDIPDGYAGQFRLRKCMRKRTVSLTPSQHAGLGVGMYSQVTSPLRRYGDLISHEQLRAFLCGRELIDKATMLLRMSEGDAAAIATHKAERQSNMHWTLVYLLQNPGWTGSAICVDRQPKQSVFLIPALGLETVLAGVSDVALNDTITVKPVTIDIPLLEVTF
ncbi:MAG: RNB domain-containing ribonuclease, partial [Treponemataceae bacterium]|nr:RNB domain-containing ribonuclease [Treponemataceae bacterium]